MSILIGKRLYKIRKERNISQKDLCDGLCSVASLSRIESGEQVPSRSLIKALYQRCGYKAPVNDVTASDAELLRDNLIKQISVDIFSCNYKDVDILLKKYENISKQMNKFEQQGHTVLSLINKSNKTGYTLEIKNKLLETFLLTHPNFCIEDLQTKKIYLTSTEITILTSIANADKSLAKPQETINILSFLKSYIKRNIIDEEEKAQHLPATLLNLAGFYDDMGDYKKAISLTREGMKLCAKYGKILLPMNIVNYGFFLARNGNVEQGINNIKDSLIFFE